MSNYRDDVLLRFIRMKVLAASFVLSLCGIIVGFGYDFQLGAALNIAAICVFFGYGGLRAIRDLVKKEFGVDIFS